MNQYCIVRKKRKTKEIEISGKLFTKFIQEQDYISGAKIVFWATLKVGGTRRIMNALDMANSFIIRKKQRERGVI